MFFVLDNKKKDIYFSTIIFYNFIKIREVSLKPILIVALVAGCNGGNHRRDTPFYSIDRNELRERIGELLRDQESVECPAGTLTKIVKGEGNSPRYLFTPKKGVTLSNSTTLKRWANTCLGEQE